MVTAAPFRGHIVRSSRNELGNWLHIWRVFHEKFFYLVFKQTEGSTIRVVKNFVLSKLLSKIFN